MDCLGHLAVSVALGSERDSFGKFGILALELGICCLIRELLIAMKAPSLVCESRPAPMQWRIILGRPNLIPLPVE